MLKDLIGAIILVGILSACTPNSTMNVNKAKYLCRDDGGLHIIKPFSEYPVICRNGQKFSVHQIDQTVIEDSQYYEVEK